MLLNVDLSMTDQDLVVKILQRLNSFSEADVNNVRRSTSGDRENYNKPNSLVVKIRHLSNAHLLTNIMKKRKKIVRFSENDQYSLNLKQILL